MNSQESENESLTPIQEAYEGLKVYLLACYICFGLRERSLSSDLFKRPLRIENKYVIPPPWTAQNIPLVAENLYKSAFAACVLTLDQALEKTFGKVSETELNPSNDLDAARVIIYSLRNSYVHGIVDPKWHLYKKYQKVWKVDEIDYWVDFTSINNSPVLMEQYNGWVGFMKLFSYCFRLVQERTRDYSRKLDFSF